MARPGAPKTPSRRATRGVIVLAAVLTGTIGRVAAGPNTPTPAPSTESVPKAPAPSERLDQLLAKLDITGALALYDEISLQTGPSLDPLVRIARATLAFCMLEGKGWDRFEAVRLLAEHGDPAGRAALAEYLESDSATFRTRAMEALEPADVANGVARLKQRSADPASQPHERVSAARALYRFGAKAAAVQALQTMVDANLVVGRREVAEALAALADPASVGPLKTLLGDPDPFIALVAASGLLRLGEAAGRERLVAALTDPSPTFRLLAAWHLAQAGDRSGLAAVKQLVEEGFAAYPDLYKLPYDLDWAIYVLSWIDPVAAQPSLDRLADNPNWVLGEVSAGRRLAELGDPRGVAVLARADTKLQGNVHMVPFRVDVLRYLGWLGDDPRVRAVAKGAIDDPSPHVRAIAMEVLARLGDPAALTAARNMLGGIGLIYRTRAAGALLDFGTGPEPVPGADGMPKTVPRHGAAVEGAEAGKPVQGAEKTRFCG